MSEEVSMNPLAEMDNEVAGVAMFNATDPRPAYADLRQRCPMARTPSGGVAIFRMEDLLDINRHPDIAGAGGATAPMGTLGAERPLIPLDIDGEDHKRYRRLLDPLFAPKRVATWEPMVRARRQRADRHVRRTGESASSTRSCASPCRRASSST